MTNLQLAATLIAEIRNISIESATLKANGLISAMTEKLGDKFEAAFKEQLKKMTSEAKRATQLRIGYGKYTVQTKDEEKGRVMFWFANEDKYFEMIEELNLGTCWNTRMDDLATCVSAYSYSK